ncbi:MAG: hypothetical protein ACM3TN_17125 [Alphaproteobacteria bacterium]
MSKNENWKILQIIPAQGGWTAVHCQESKNHEIMIFSRPIICWAVVEAVADPAAVRREVRGVEQESSVLTVVDDWINAGQADGHGTDQNQYFLGYNDPDAHKESQYWMKQANERLRMEREKDQRREIA